MTLAAERIEDLRVSWERELERIFASRPRGTGIAPVDPGAREQRVRLEETMAARVHRVARDAAARLGFTEPFVLYQTPQERHRLTAQALLHESPFGVRLVGPVASVLDDAGLATLIGHELGHWLASGPRASPPSLVLEAMERGAPRDVAELCVLASELTADRFALIAAGGDLEASVRLDVAVTTLDSPHALGLRELDHLAELRGRVDRREDPLLVGNTGYPTSALRLYAAWLFWRSDLHRELTGAGPGELAIGDVDALLKSLCAERRPWPEPREEPAPVETVSPWAAASRERDDDRALKEALAEIDDVERRFRELEAADDLEARFRELEERERRGE